MDYNSINILFIGGVDMIKSKLHELMGKERHSIQDVHKKTGLSRNTIANMYHAKIKRIDYETLERLCALYDCQPGDLLEYIPDPSNKK